MTAGFEADQLAPTDAGEAHGNNGNELVNFFNLHPKVITIFDPRKRQDRAKQGKLTLTTERTK